MIESAVRFAVMGAAGVLWVAGLRLFLQSNLSRRRKAGWTAFLALVGVGIGIVLPLGDMWRKFVLLMVILPVLGTADVLLLASRRGLSFWIRACGFEVCTVFALAAAARFVLDLVGTPALLRSVR